jgi:hypothetical protein
LGSFHDGKGLALKEYGPPVAEAAHLSDRRSVGPRRGKPDRTEVVSRFALTASVFLDEVCGVFGRKLANGKFTVLGAIPSSKRNYAIDIIDISDILLRWT